MSELSPEEYKEHILMIRCKVAQNPSVDKESFMKGYCELKEPEPPTILEEMNYKIRRMWNNIMYIFDESSPLVFMFICVYILLYVR
jgi:hypothetical protein